MFQGPEVCATQYESECWTKNEEHDVVDDVVDCKTVVEEKCADETSGKFQKKIFSISRVYT